MVNEEDIKKLEEEYNSICLDTSTLRKKGKDTSLIDILLLNIKPKLKMVKVSYEKYDCEIIKKELEHIKNEIIKIKEGLLPINIVNAVYEANEALFNNKLEEAKEKYTFIKKFYDKCSDKLLKKIIYEACIELHKKLSEK